MSNVSCPEGDVSLGEQNAAEELKDHKIQIKVSYTSIMCQVNALARKRLTILSLVGLVPRAVRGPKYGPYSIGVANRAFLGRK